MKPWQSQSFQLEFFSGFRSPLSSGFSSLLGSSLVLARLYVWWNIPFLASTRPGWKEYQSFWRGG